MKNHKAVLPCCAVLICVAALSCGLYFNSKIVEEIDKHKMQESPKFEFIARSPTKAHLIDGSVIVFAKGFEVKNDVLIGKGMRYPLTRQQGIAVTQVPLDSVACLERYKKQMQSAPFLASIPAVTAASAFAFAAIFGSCPTVYSHDGEKYSLEAENFSYSISQRFEADDLDRLDFGKAVNDEYHLKIANEALETHYINSVNLLAVEHAPGFEAFPSANHRVVLFGKESEMLSANSKSGCDVTALISSRDERWYQSDSLAVSELTHTITQDWIEARVKIPQHARKMYVALRLRNTLMNTVLLYDVMLRSQGIAAVDWLGSETENLFYAWRLGQWYKKHFGLRIQVFDGKQFDEAVRIGDTGPIAWHQVAAELPAPPGEVALLRFSFLPDNWAIDWIGISFDENEDFRVRQIVCSEIADRAGNSQADLIALIKKKDDRYLVTYPGESYLLKFKVNPEPEGRRRTYFLKSRGFYVEWLRREWLTQNDGEAQRFELNDQAIMRTAQLWLAKKPRFEREFFESKIAHEGGELQ